MCVSECVFGVYTMWKTFTLYTKIAAALYVIPLVYTLCDSLSPRSFVYVSGSHMRDVIRSHICKYCAIDFYFNKTFRLHSSQSSQ